jgi:hypothetical protein
MELWQTMTRGIYVVTFVVTAISLLVGGIAVMNIMLVSVIERIRDRGPQGSSQRGHPAAVPRRVGDPSASAASWVLGAAAFSYGWRASSAT